jgi:signal transduction histidine kinase
MASSRLSRIPWSLLLLGVALVLAAAQTWAAVESERRHRALAERVLHDLAEAAAWRFLANVEVELHFVVPEAFGPVVESSRNLPQLRRAPSDVAAPVLRDGTVDRWRTDGDVSETLARVARAAEAVARCGDPGEDGKRFYFALPLPNGPVTLAGTTPPSEVVALVRDTVARRLANGDREEWYLASRFRENGSRALVYVVTRDPDDRPRMVLGFETCNDALWRWAFTRAFARGVIPSPLLAGTPQESVLTVHAEATGAFGASYTSGGTTADSAVAVSVQSGSRIADPRGGIRVTVTMRQTAPDRLIIGGLPRSRLPVLLATLALIVGLVVLALHQWWREQALIRLRADFTSSVSHELRTPLAQILLFAETLEAGRTRGPVESERALGIIIQEARRLQHLVENVLVLSRAERHAVLPPGEPTDPDTFVAEVVERFRPIAARAGTAIRFLGDPGPMLLLPRDPLAQVLLNYLDNAVKYGPAGQVINVSLDRTPHSLLLSVEDEGPGVAPEERERIWQPFVRGAAGQQAIPGGGIGLAVVQGLMSELGGRAWVGAGLLRGARFVAEFPATRWDGGDA